MLPKVRRDKKRLKPTGKTRHSNIRRKIKKITGNSRAHLTSSTAIDRSGTLNNEILTSIDLLCNTNNNNVAGTQANTLSNLISKSLSGLVAQQDGISINAHNIATRGFSTSSKRHQITTTSSIMNSLSDYSP
eukprot:UN02437